MFKFISILFLLIPFTGLAQNIHFGQRADSVQLLVANEVQTHYNANSYLTKLYAETRYKDKQIIEVLLIKENILIPHLSKSANYCIRYVMVNGYLEKVITDYSNSTLDEVRSLFLPERTNVAGYYFVSNYSQFSRLYELNNGHTIDELQLTNWDRLPLSVKEAVYMLNRKH